MGPDVFRALEKQSGFRLTIWTRRQCLSLGYSCTTQSTGFDSSEKVHEGGERMLVLPKEAPFASPALCRRFWLRSSS